MRLMTKPTWHYNESRSLALSGIYTNNDLKNLRDYIVFPAEKNRILNTMARGIRGKPTLSQGISLSYLLDKNSLRKIIKSVWKKFREHFFLSEMQVQD